VANNLVIYNTIVIKKALHEIAKIAPARCALCIHHVVNKLNKKNVK
tara:strand:+ start:39 stop:176 length:138 start_codon:yes stop_codon:yes gene_type:complete